MGWRTRNGIVGEAANAVPIGHWLHFSQFAVDELSFKAESHGELTGAGQIGNRALTANWISTGTLRAFGRLLYRTIDSLLAELRELEQHHFGAIFVRSETGADLPRFQGFLARFHQPAFSLMLPRL